MMTFNELAALCSINKIFGFEPKVAHALIEHFGSAEEIFRLSGKDLEFILGPYSKYHGLICRASLDDGKKEMESLYSKGIRFIGCTDPEYPSLLQECDDRPVGIYVKASSEPHPLFNNIRRIAIIGTRDISPYGKEWCRRIVESIAESPDKPVIVSGLAIGTDICAHRAALEAGLPTFGIMATGADTVYPFRHMDFAQKLSRTEGCALITDYPLGTPPLPIHFLRRNRIIAGLSEAIILVESKIKGGGMMTSRLGFSYNRDIYALPGRADDITSQGCNLLIKEKIAEPIIELDTLMKNLQLRSGSKAHKERTVEDYYKDKVSWDKVGRMSRILLEVRKNPDISIEELASRMNIGYSITRSLIETLEIDGFITIDILQRCRINR